MLEFSKLNFGRRGFLNSKFEVNLQFILMNYACKSVHSEKILWDDLPCATKFEQCEKNGKAYVERIRGSEQGFEYLIKHKDSWYGHGFLCFASHCFSHAHRPHCEHHKVVAVFWLSWFASVFVPCSLLALSSLLSQCNC